MCLLLDKPSRRSTGRSNEVQQPFNKNNNSNSKIQRVVVVVVKGYPLQDKPLAVNTDLSVIVRVVRVGLP